MQNTSIKYPELIQKLTKVFETKGLDFEKAESLARILTEGELLGHTTHGLALVKPYLDELESGQMETDGSFEILNSTNTTETWDGRYLPGTWLTEKAIQKASEIAKKEGIGLYGFAKPYENSLLPTIDYYLSSPIDSFKGDDKNIATFARIYNDLPLDFIKEKK